MSTILNPRIREVLYYVTYHNPYSQTLLTKGADNYISDIKIRKDVHM